MQEHDVRHRPPAQCLDLADDLQTLLGRRKLGEIECDIDIPLDRPAARAAGAEEHAKATPGSLRPVTQPYFELGEMSRPRAFPYGPSPNPDSRPNLLDVFHTLRVLRIPEVDGLLQVEPELRLGVREPPGRGGR